VLAAETAAARLLEMSGTVLFLQPLSSETSEETMTSGQLFILVGPSGAGKNTLLAMISKKIPGIRQMPTATTRPKRLGEAEGRHHFFLTDAEFDQKIRNGDFVEWRHVHRHRYGTLRSVVQSTIASGEDCLADVEVLGAFAVKESFGKSVVLIFIDPPSLSVLEERIRARGNISEDEIAVRLSRAPFEMSFKDKCDYVVVNRDISVALNNIVDIINQECRLRAGAQGQSWC